LTARFQSTLPAWGATASDKTIMHYVTFQSTLPAWGATAACARLARLLQISIHAPRVGSDVVVYGMVMRFVDFNPRSPRGERHSSSANKVVHGKFQSTLPAWGATVRARAWDVSAPISIHAPRVGSDVELFRVRLAFRRISIHAPRVGSDGGVSRFHGSEVNFNPRSPRGERRCCHCSCGCGQVISIHAPRVGSD